jgi:hypothetical protein
VTGEAGGAKRRLRGTLLARHIVWRIGIGIRSRLPPKGSPISKKQVQDCSSFFECLLYCTRLYLHSTALNCDYGLTKELHTHTHTRINTHTHTDVGKSRPRYKKSSTIPSPSSVSFSLSFHPLLSLPVPHPPRPFLALPLSVRVLLVFSVRSPARRAQ